VTPLSLTPLSPTLLSLTPQPTAATPLELTLGTIYRLFLERSQRLQSDVAEQLNTQMHYGTDQRQRGSDWTWKLNRVATDKRRFSAQEYATIAQALNLTPVEYLTLLRAADIPPTPDESTAALRLLRPFMESCPWPVYCLSYRLDVIAWNAVTACVYHLGPAAAGPDLPPTLPTGEPRVNPAVREKMRLLPLLFDPQGPLRPLLEERGHDEWRHFMRRELRFILSYWAPLTVFGEPSWMTAVIRTCAPFPDFKQLWQAAMVERVKSQLQVRDEVDALVAGHIPTMRVGSTFNFLLEVNPVATEPRLEMVVQMPTDRVTAQKLLRDTPASDAVGACKP
jgi:hypothetical protein